MKTNYNLQNLKNHPCVECLKNEPIIRLENYYGSYSVIDDLNGYVLLEHNTYGDETALLVVKASDFEWKEYTNKKSGEKVNRPFFNKNVSVYETFDDIKTALEDYELI